MYFESTFLSLHYICILRFDRFQLKRTVGSLEERKQKNKLEEIYTLMVLKTNPRIK